jgi:hypothetical protein
VLNPDGTAVENGARADVIKSLRDAGLELLFIGVESLCESQLLRFGKGSNVKASLDAVDLVRQLGIPVEIGFMPFDPYVTVRELKQTVATLRLTGLWSCVSNLFSEMRVQRNTPYERWLKAKALLREFDPNTISYKWQYSDPRAGTIARSCLEWESSFLPVHRALRTIERTLTNPAVAGMFDQVRNLDLEVFEWLTSEQPVLQDVSIGALDVFRDKRKELLRRIAQVTPAGAIEERHLKRQAQDSLSA